MINKLIILLIILIIAVCVWKRKLIEFFGTSPGTLIQLQAKGPMDYYLTGYPWNYYSMFRPDSYSYSHSHRRPYYGRSYPRSRFYRPNFYRPHYGL